MGATIDEVVINAEDSVRDWISDMEERGQPIAEPTLLEAANYPQAMPQRPSYGSEPLRLNPACA